MNIETWLLFFSAYFVVTLSPGPNVLLVLSNAVKYGYKAVAVTIAANLFCQLLIIIAIAYGAGAILAQSPALFFVLKVLGGLYLIYLGVKGLLTKRRDSVAEVEQQLSTNTTISQNSSISHNATTSQNTSTSLRNPKLQRDPRRWSTKAVFKEAFMVSASNPKTVIFLSAFLPQFLSSETALVTQFSVMFLTIALIVSFVHMSYSLLANKLSKRYINSRLKRVLSRLSSTAFIGFGTAVLFTQRKI